MGWDRGGFKFKEFKYGTKNIAEFRKMEAELHMGLNCQTL